MKKILVSIFAIFIFAPAMGADFDINKYNKYTSDEAEEVFTQFCRSDSPFKCNWAIKCYKSLSSGSSSCSTPGDKGLPTEFTNYAKRYCEKNNYINWYIDCFMAVKHIDADAKSIMKEFCKDPDNPKTVRGITCKYDGNQTTADYHCEMEPDKKPEDFETKVIEYCKKNTITGNQNNKSDLSSFNTAVSAAKKEYETGIEELLKNNK